MKHNVQFTVIIGLILILGWLIGCAQKAEEPALKEALSEISSRDLHAHIGFLASDELQGRGTPSLSLDTAARYLQAEFEKYSLTPGGEDGKFQQPYTIDAYPLTEDNFTVSLSIRDKEKKLSRNEIIPLFAGLAGTSIEAKGSIVFAGYGITAPEREWDDYQDLDVRGKVVLVIEGAPWEVDLNIPFGYDVLLGKWVNASQHRAAGFIYATPLFGKEEPQSVSFVRSLVGESVPSRKSLEPQIRWCVPGIAISFEVANELVETANQGSLSSLMEKTNKENKPLCFPLEQCQLSLKLEAEPKEATAYNVIGILKGSDPKLAEEYIAITAHYDHLGVRQPVNGDSIYNGADDDASGTAGVLELAQAFSSLPEEARPRRSILFLLVSGEELGLYGSAHYAENPTIPMSQIKANINLDMIGRCPEEGVEVIAPGSDWLAEMVKKSAQSLELETLPERHPEWRLIYYSDQFSFVYHNIPAVFCFTGDHPDYHQPSDEIEKLNFSAMEKIVRAVFLAGWKLANQDEIPPLTPPAYLVHQ
ncbi:hypothetical protein CEE39_06670 [bacterium (candidate division B38) B3_B38]|nr:MAG: hypothetical protein CEE39_06670 [bacterium (candidate division B38) B3_B38]